MHDAKSAITPSMTAAFDGMLSEFGTKRFRLNDLAERIYPLTRPHNRQTATKFAGMIFKGAAKAGTIHRTGHLHWMLVCQKRRLRSGREVPVTNDLVEWEASFGKQRCIGRSQGNS